MTDMSTALPEEVVPNEPIPIPSENGKKNMMKNMMKINNDLIAVLGSAIVSHIPQINDNLSKFVKNKYIASLIKSIIVVILYMMIKKYLKK